MIKTSSWIGGTTEEYETQHFGFGTQRFKIAVRQMIEQKINGGVKDLQTYLKQKLDLNDKDTVTLTHSCDKLIQLYCKRAEPCIDKIDAEIVRILGVPPNVLLPEDEVQLHQASDEQYEKLKEEVASLRRQVERGAMMEALLTAEEEEIASIEKVCETAKKDMEILDLLLKNEEQADCMKKIQDETLFLCASTPFMKADDKISNIFD